jgi:8-oxo-dGTP pyrophosphatase MutT (NUDIX family)
MVAIPKRAATVILLREKLPGGFEVFLLKRHEKSSFMGGNFVYPGGRVDPGDAHFDLKACCRGLTPAEADRILGEALPGQEGLAYWIAAIRELFEEAGVLLACDRNGNPLAARDPLKRGTLLNYRNLLHQGKATLLDLARQEELLLSPDQLIYYAHWVTPEARSERFDTRFFLARHPEGQEAIYDDRETTDGLWLSPREALDKNFSGDVVLSPPTLKTLEDLSRFERIEQITRSLNEISIETVLPVLTKVSGEAFILFPWDPDYDTFRNGRLPGSINHGRPSRPDDNTTRVVFRDGRWLPFFRTGNQPA